ncbi:MAG TPA: asparagine synthase (glutamine-hydrolyzing) [Blastocatellia bacterium]|nr:asparagine synthase (glutamine-hydrolyzing) [Blastocatellia bacterium]
MCGICGMVTPRQSNRRVEMSQLVRMRDVMEHRGPDDAGYYLREGVGLGHRRLSIVDVGGGHQPMANEDNTIWIAFNGEIYNHQNLRPMLEASGHQYRSNCDTETIVHLYEERGERGVVALSGMFAFAIWDENQNQLLLARDRLGIKPLYYTLTDDGSLFFASEIKSLLASSAVKPVLNLKALPDYMANKATSGEETLFLGVKRLLPGHTLVWQNGRIQITKYWDVSFDRWANESHRRDEDYIAEWREIFREAVRSHLMADVPLGMFLSGGIDSSAIAAMMSGMVRDPIKTFSVAFAEGEANELNYARMVARAFNTDHHEIVVSPEEFFASLPKLIWHEDEPLAHDSSVPLYFVSHLAAKHVKVVLSGEGSDELMAGYYRYRKTVYNLALGERYYGWTSKSMRHLLQRGLRQSLNGSRLGNKLERTFLFLPASVESLYFENFAVFPGSMQQAMFTPETTDQFGQVSPYQWVNDQLQHSETETLLDRLLYADLKTYLHELLMRQDQMSMAWSLESRVPFLDSALVDFTARLPERLKLNGWKTKYILRRSMEGILPDAILKRRKMGFPVPLGGWFRGRFRSVIDEYVLGPRTMERGLFDAAFIKNLVNEHQSGAKDHSERLWSLLNLELWLRQFIDGEEFSVWPMTPVTEVLAQV